MFLPWIEAEFAMGEQTARRLMHVAASYGGKSNIVLDLDPTALYELAAPSTPQPVRNHVEELLVDGQKVTVADIRRLKAEARSTRQPVAWTKSGHASRAITNQDRSSTRRDTR